MGAFDPFTDFAASKAELATLQKGRDEDRAGNLRRRMDFFVAQSAAKARKNLGFVPNIVQNGFTCVGVPAEGGNRDLAFSIGLFYTFGFPELMLVGDSPEVDVRALNAIVQMTSQMCVKDGTRLTSAIDRKTLSANGAQLVGALQFAIESAGFTATWWGQPDEKFLGQYAYGYGWYFYRHFLDDAQVPLLAAKIGGAGEPAAEPVQVRIPLREGDEVIWAEPLDDDTYRVDNFVATAAHIALGDVVRCKPAKSGLPEVVAVVERGPFSALGLTFDAKLAGEDLKAVVDAGLGLEVAPTDAPPPEPPEPEKVDAVLRAFFETRVGELVRALTELGCEPHFFTATTMGLSVPHEALDEVKEMLDDQGVDSELLSGPDEPAPYEGPFDPPEES